MIDEARDYDVLQTAIADAIGDLDNIRFQVPGARLGGADDSQRLAGALRTTLLAFSASLGECRQAVPYSTMRPVRDKDGKFMWCCNHNPEHCG